MTVFSFLPFAASLFCVALAFAGLLRKRPTPATWCFFLGMLVLAVSSLVAGRSLLASELPDVVWWLTLDLIAKSFLPAAWLGFSLTFSRGDYRSSLARWRVPLAVLSLLPVALALGFRENLLQVVTAGPEADLLQMRFTAAATALNAVILVALVLVVMNLEQTFRAAVGTMRWRLKFVVLGLAVIFSTQIYVRSQGILYSAPNMALLGLESSAILLGGLFLAVAYARTGLVGTDVYPSRVVLSSSLTVLAVGGYLVIVGVLAQVVRRFGGVESFQFQALVVLVGMAVLAVLLLSDRLRQRVHGFVGRHFRKAQHDSVRVWTGFSQRLANVKDEAGLSVAAARFVSETFDVLSVTVWLLDEGKAQLLRRATTTRLPDDADGAAPAVPASNAVAAGLRTASMPFDLEAVNENWAEELRQLNPVTFPSKGGNRWCLPLTPGEQCLGALVLADRVNGAIYTFEELELLKCIGDQITSVLLNLRFANEVVKARELEAFRTMSAFFVHDLKNAAASLNLMLKNLPAHFDNPAFREDALRGVGNTARRIDEMIARLSALRQRPDFRPEAVDLNQIVVETIDALGELRSLDLARDLKPLPLILADREQISSVVANLLLNARDALGLEGRISVATELRGGRAVLSVADDGCGMSPAFLTHSLFRPFQTTKKKGLGIGMFQSRMVVEAHGGSIQVESEAGKGTTVCVSFPAKDAS